MTPAWSDIGELLARGSATAFSAELVVRPRQEPAPSVLMWTMDDPRANLHAGPGRTRIARDGPSRVRLDHADGRHTIFNDGTVWQVGPDDTTTEFHVMSLNASGFAGLLIDQPENSEDALGYGYPSGPVVESTHQGRPVAVVAGDPGDGFGPAQISIDLATGIVVRVVAEDDSWEAWLEDVDTSRVEETEFDWNGPIEPPRQIPVSAAHLPPPSTEYLAPGPDPDPLAASPRGRLLRARLDELVIADGQLPPPRVGETIEVHLTFFEAPSPMAADSTSVRAFAEPIESGTPHEDHLGIMRWPTILRGDGWTATWSAPRPAVGHVLLDGHFAIIHDAAAVHWFTPTRAAVVGIRVNRLTGPLPTDSDSDPIPGGAWSSEPSCPTGFAPHLAYEKTDGPAPAIAVALDLDIDAAEPPRNVDDFVPGGLSALGAELWAGDSHRPILRRLRGGDVDQPEDHLLPLAVRLYSGPVTPYAGTGGLWMEHAHTLWSVEVTRDAPARLHDLGTVGWASAVAVGPRLVTSGRSLRCFDARGELSPIPLPAEMASASALARVEEGLLVVGREPNRDDDEDLSSDHRFGRTASPQRFRLALRDHSGEWVVGESFGLPRPASAVGRNAAGVWAICADLVLRFDDALMRSTAHRLAYTPISAGPTASGMWCTLECQQVALTLSDDERPDPWGLRGLLADVDPRLASRRSLVVRLDDELRATAAALADSPRPSVAVTSDDTVWFTGSHLRGITVSGGLIRIENSIPGELER